jgi:hypothetical protein
MEEIIYWLNKNQGLLSAILFFGSLIFGWITGIYRALITKPKFKIRVIPKMTFGTVYLTGEKYTPPRMGTYDVNITAFVVYVEIINIGSASSNLGKVKIGYYKDDGGKTWFQKRLWITETNILDDFSIPTGDGLAIIVPHLRQVNLQFDQYYNGFLEVGQSKIGAAYFEQLPSWGNHYPRRNKNGKTEIKVSVEDAFGNTYSKIVDVPIKTLEECLRYNSKFGFTQRLFDKDHMGDKPIGENKENRGGIS